MKFTGVDDQAFIELVTKYHSEFWSKVNEPFKLYKLEGALNIELSSRLAVCAGKARPQKQQISLNYRLLKDKPEELRITYGHELAHLIAAERLGPGVGHDRRWKRIMLELGLAPERCHDMDVSAFQRAKQPRIDYECDNCGQQYKLTTYKHNKLQRGANYHCRKCGPKLGKISPW